MYAPNLRGYNRDVEPKVLGVLSGRDLSKNLLRKWADSADVLLAADGGADLLLEVQKKPDRIIGDFDSVTQDALASGAILHKLEDQTRTDCEKMLDVADSLGYREMTLVGVEGDQLDHVLATLNAALSTRIRIRMGLRTGIGQVVESGETVAFSTKPGRKVSVLPLLPTLASLRGVEWPLDTVRLIPGIFWSASNRSNGAEVVVEVSEGAVIVTLEVPEAEQPAWS